jgi:ABC-2 type transport system permease protein
MIRNCLIIWKREFREYFYTPLAFVFTGLFTLIVGILFAGFVNAYERYSAPTQWGTPGQTIPLERVMESFYGNVHVFLMIVIPFFTMRLFTSESRQNTFALLLTSPVSTWEITFAKFFSASGVVALNIATTLMFPAFLFLFTDKATGSGPDLGIVFTTYLGLFLVGMTYVAVGEFWSSVTDSQMIAVVVTFFNIFVFWLLSLFAQGDTGAFQSIANQFSPNAHFGNLSKGLLELRGITYFLSMIGFYLFLTQRSLESRAWRA